VLQQIASGSGSARVDGILAHVDMLDDTLLVDHKCGAVGELLLFVQNAVLFGDSSLEVTEKREHEAFLLCEGGISGSTIDTDSQHLGAILLELGDISLIRLELLGSAASKGQNVEGQHNIFLPPVIAQLYLLAGLVGQAEVGGLIAHLQRSGLRR